MVESALYRTLAELQFSLPKTDGSFALEMANEGVVRSVSARQTHDLTMAPVLD